MRLGGPLFADCSDPERWIAALRSCGYSAAYCPVDDAAGDDVIRAYVDAAKAGAIVIAEVGAWSNPLAPDEDARQEALSFNKARLDLADRIGARCCVNISGSRGERWDGPHPGNFTRDTFDLIVETVRAIIDAVKPTRTFYALETMPCMYPDSPDSYVDLMRAIDRPAFGVHLDPTNLVSSPRRYFGNGALIRECFAKLGPHIKSCHAKDVALDDNPIAHLSEVRPGLGGLDYATYLRELSRLPGDTPLMLEHLETGEEYRLAAGHIRSVAEKEGVAIG